MRVLKIDEKWSIEYDEANNDRPVQWLRHGEPNAPFDEPNSTVALFYALLSLYERHAK